MAPSLRPLQHEADGVFGMKLRGFNLLLGTGRHPTPPMASFSFPSCPPGGFSIVLAGSVPAQTCPSQAAKDAGDSLSSQFGVRALVEGLSSQRNPFARPI